MNKFNIYNQDHQKILLDLLKSSSKKTLKKYEAKLIPKLTNIECLTLKFTQSKEFSDGSWYRPIHNLIVPLTMKKIYEEKKDLNKDLMLAVILHDIGYSEINVANTLNGASWEHKDKRVAHMEAGALLAKSFFENDLKLNTDLNLYLCNIIKEHDNPYIGKELKENDTKYLRDADRSFVVSIISFYKDFLAYLNDEKYKNYKHKFTLNFFLHLRLKSFYKDYDSLPKKVKENSDKNLFASLDNVEKFESIITESTRQIISSFFINRSFEISKLENVNLEGLEEIVLKGLFSDLEVF